MQGLPLLGIGKMVVSSDVNHFEQTLVLQLSPLSHWSSVSLLENPLSRGVSVASGAQMREDKQSRLLCLHYDIISPRHSRTSPGLPRLFSSSYHGVSRDKYQALTEEVWTPTSHPPCQNTPFIRLISAICVGSDPPAHEPTRPIRSIRRLRYTSLC